MQLLVPLASAGLFAFAAMTATAAGAASISANGTGHGTAMNEVMPVTDSLVVIKAATDYTGFDTESPDNPLAGATGPCFGSMLIDGGAVSGGGLCEYTDTDGDLCVIRWDAEGMSAEGRTSGAWEVVGGTGKWAMMTGSGRFDAGVDGQGVYTNNITGAFSGM